MGIVRVVSLDGFLKDPDAIIAWLGSGENLIMLHEGSFLAFILPVREEDLDKTRKMMRFKDLSRKAGDISYHIKTGEEILVSLGNREIALFTARLPQVYISSFTGD